MKTKIFVLLVALFIAQLCLASALTINSVTNDPESIQPGEKISLSLSIKNNLGEDISGAVITLNLNGNTQTGIASVPFAPYQSSNEYRIDEISDDDSEKARFELIAFSDAVSGTYTIPVTASYTLDNETKVQNEPLGVITVIINAKPKIEISSEESFLIKGTSGKVTIKIVNSGLGNCKFLNVELNPSTKIEITGPDRVYIGNIESNDFDSADFDVFVSLDAPSTVNLPVKITYTDSQNNPITEDKTIIIKTYTQKEAIGMGLIKGDNTLVIVLIVVIAIVLFFVYRRIRKRMKNKRNNSH